VLQQEHREFHSTTNCVELASSMEGKLDLQRRLFSLQIVAELKLVRPVLLLVRNVFHVIRPEQTQTSTNLVPNVARL
jgi:hypothetical protein